MPTPTADLAGLSIDPETPGLFTRPDYYELLARLRSESPVHGYAPHAWALTRYDDIRAVSRDPAHFSNAHGVLMNDPARSGAAMAGSVLHMDPPQHAPWRKVASRWFTPRAVTGLEARVAETCTELLDAAPVGEELDLVASIAAPLPVTVIAELLGIGDGDRADFRRWSDAVIEGTDAESMDMTLVGELLGFLGDHVTRRRDHPGDDLLSTLVQSEAEDRALLDHEIVMYCMALLVAGNETTRHLVSGSVVAFAEHPDQRSGVVAGPDRSPVDIAVEECLRWVTPIQAFGRTVVEDTTVGEQAVEAGDWIVLLYASANRDEAVFGPDADRFDARRPANPAHLAFGFGEHLCLGAALARMEARVFLDQFLRRFPHYQQAGPGTLVRSTLVRGYRDLPVVLR